MIKLPEHDIEQKSYYEIFVNMSIDKRNNNGYPRTKPAL